MNESCERVESIRGCKQCVKRSASGAVRENMQGFLQRRKRVSPAPSQFSFTIIPMQKSLHAGFQR
jgi:hypothetical protein